MITTVSHNVGDDFVRDGIIYLLGRLLPDFQVAQVHKHQPITSRPEWEWVYTRGYCSLMDRMPGGARLHAASRLDRLLPLNTQTDKVLNCDLLVQCGAPVYWLHGANSCARSEWYGPLIRRRWSRVRDRVPFLNLAGGSCQTYQSNGKEFEGADETLAFIREFFDDCRLTTLRDELAGKILLTAGRTATILPCTSIFARRRLRIEPQAPRFVALNYMRTGGHYRFVEGLAPTVWERTFGDFINRLPPNEEYVLVCHSRAELADARRLFPKIKTFWSTDYRAYVEFLAGAKYGIFNRVHAAFMLASFGRPSFVVGNDSRTRMSDLIGLKHAFVDEVTTARLLVELGRLQQTWGDYAQMMDETQRVAERTYLTLLRDVLSKSLRLRDGQPTD